MQDGDAYEELRLSVVHGGTLVCAPAADAAQRASLCSMAWGLSMALGGDCVRVHDYLPGLHLDIQALRPPEPLPPGPHPHPVRQTMLHWNRMEHRLWNALHDTWPAEAIEETDTEVRCVIGNAAVRRVNGASVAFTLRCLWPGVLGDARSLARMAG